MIPLLLALLMVVDAPPPSPSPAPRKKPPVRRHAAPRRPAPSPAPSGAPSPAPSPVAQASPTPPPSADILFALVKKAPAFSADSGRTALRETMTVPVMVPGVDDKGYFMEIQWTDKEGAAHTGVVTVAHKTVLEVPWVVKPDGGEWGLVQVFEDKNMPGLMDELKRTRIAANEAMAVADIRTFVTGEMLFMSLADGAFGSFRCLHMPSDCIVDIPSEQMMPPDLLAESKKGYRRTFHPGAPVTNAKAKKASPPPFVKSFAFTAVPLVPGESGVRGFCGDQTGKICVTADGKEPAVVDGMCATPCTEYK